MCLRSASDPRAPIAFADGASLFLFHVQRSLVAGTVRKNWLAIDMETDVFSFFFNGRGVEVEGGYKEYSLEDFDEKFFARDWYVHYNQHA